MGTSVNARVYASKSKHRGNIGTGSNTDARRHGWTGVRRGTPGDARPVGACRGICEADLDKPKRGVGLRVQPPEDVLRRRWVVLKVRLPVLANRPSRPWDSVRVLTPPIVVDQLSIRIDGEIVIVEAASTVNHAEASIGLALPALAICGDGLTIDTFAGHGLARCPCAPNPVVSPAAIELLKAGDVTLVCVDNGTFGVSAGLGVVNSNHRSSRSQLEVIVVVVIIGFDWTG